LEDACVHPEASIRARGLRAAGELGRLNLMATIRRNLQEEDRCCRFHAAWSAALLGDDTAVPVLQDLAGEGGLYEEKACEMAFRRMEPPHAHAWQHKLGEKPETGRIAVIGAGVIGDPVSIPWLIRMMEEPELARVAGESVAMITGVDLAYEDLDGEWPEGFEAGPTELPEDEDVEMDPDEDLAWADPELISAWWDKNKRSFQNGTRYFLGRPMTPENLKQGLRQGFQRQRAAAALELALQHPEQPLFEVRAPGLYQQEMLGLK